MRNKYKGDDIRSRLGSTVIRYKNHPYFCEANGENLDLLDLVTKRVTHRVAADDPYIDISSLTLGYFNIGMAAVYIQRHPYRRYKQGVDLNALEYRTLSKDFVYGAHDMFCQGFVEGLLDRYPSFAKAVSNMLTDKAQSVALSRDVALKREKDLFKVHVKGDEVGWIKSGTNRVLIPPTESSWATVWILKDTSGAWEVVEGVK